MLGTNRLVDEPEAPLELSTSRAGTWLPTQKGVLPFLPQTNPKIPLELSFVDSEVADERRDPIIPNEVGPSEPGELHRSNEELFIPQAAAASRELSDDESNSVSTYISIVHEEEEDNDALVFLMREDHRSRSILDEDQISQFLAGILSMNRRLESSLSHSAGDGDAEFSTTNGFSSRYGDRSQDVEVSIDMLRENLDHFDIEGVSPDASELENLQFMLSMNRNSDSQNEFSLLHSDLAVEDEEAEEEEDEIDEEDEEESDEYAVDFDPDDEDYNPYAMPVVDAALKSELGTIGRMVYANLEKLNLLDIYCGEFLRPLLCRFHSLSTEKNSLPDLTQLVHSVLPPLASLRLASSRPCLDSREAFVIKAMLELYALYFEKSAWSNSGPLVETVLPCLESFYTSSPVEILNGVTLLTKDCLDNESSVAGFLEVHDCREGYVRAVQTRRRYWLNQVDGITMHDLFL